ncbi:MAG: hypothetical protein R2830_27395 [Saprospiraceae bacterium]
MLTTPGPLKPDFQYEIPSIPSEKELVVMNGNEAFAFGTLTRRSLLDVPYHGYHFRLAHAGRGV